MTYFYPRISEHVALTRIRAMNLADVESAHTLVVFEPSSRYHYDQALDEVPTSRLEELRIEILNIARETGMTERTSNQYAEFDRRAGKFLYNAMDILPAEAAVDEVWNFITLFVLPDVAMWRYPNRGPRGKGPKPDFDRWLGTHRNVFRKTWWRMAMLGAPLNDQIGEDEAVAIMERPTFGGNPLIASAIVKAHIQTRQGSLVPATELMRAGTKRLRRYVPFMVLDALTDKELDQLVLEIFEESKEAMEAYWPVRKLRGSAAKSGRAIGFAT